MMTHRMIRWTRFTVLTGRTGPWLRYFHYVVCFHSPHHISDSSLTVELNRRFIPTIMQPRIRNAPHPFMEPRRMTPPCPREHQGGFYDIL
jgi:hypothetical protein